MKQMLLRKFAIATSTIAVAALVSVGWSEQGSAQPRTRLHVYRLYQPFNPYRADSSAPWYAVRAYYAGGPWCAVGPTGVGYGPGYGVGYGTAGGPWGGQWTCYNDWADYKQRNGIGCDPGTIVKGGDAIDYICQ